jgi:hypothetical protein
LFDPAAKSAVAANAVALEEMNWRRFMASGGLQPSGDDEE